MPVHERCVKHVKRSYKKAVDSTIPFVLIGKKRPAGKISLVHFTMAWIDSEERRLCSGQHL